MPSLDGVTGDDLKWLLLNGIGAHLSMPPSSLGAVADVSPQSFLDAARHALQRLGVTTLSKADARDLLSTARVYAATNSATSKACRLFAVLPVAEPRWSAEMDAAELEAAGATLPEEEGVEFTEEALRERITAELGTKYEKDLERLQDDITWLAGQSMELNERLTEFQSRADAITTLEQMRAHIKAMPMPKLLRSRGVAAASA